MSNSLEPDQDRLNVGPDLGPNCLHRLSADNKSCHKQAKSYKISDLLFTLQEIESTMYLILHETESTSSLSI